jgi:Fe-S-cluster containining protein
MLQVPRLSTPVAFLVRGSSTGPSRQSSAILEGVLPAEDRSLIQLVDAALAESARKSGAWLACRPGCTPCCMGPFAISALDALRLRRGLDELDAADPDRASRVRTRAAEWVARNAAGFPGDPQTGLLSEDEDAFQAFANDEPCPALDPASGLCELYAARPMTCRVFGPPIRLGDQELGVCELCFDGAAETDIASCAVDLDLSRIESELLSQIDSHGETIVAFCLAQ